MVASDWTVNETEPATAVVRGRIHSIETCGTVDGPGIRFVVFTQGCLLRCLYCHNPDNRDPHQGREVTVDELMGEIQRYRSYMEASGGGLTLSGGEPLLQPEFAAELFRRCRAQGIHTALDTSGFPDFDASKPVLDLADLVLLDLKSFDPDTYHRVTHVAIEPTLRVARYLDQIHKPTWIRFVLVPGLTDELSNLQGWAQFVAGLSCVEKVEVLPFHKMGEYKWQQMGYDYALSDVQPPTAAEIDRVVRCFQSYGLPIEFT